VRRTSHADTHCSIARALDIVGDPWTLLVVREAFFGTRRFEDFRRALGIPRATLADRLDLLVDHGVLERRPYLEHPPRDEYVLTERGQDLQGVIIALMAWGDRWGGLPEPPVVLTELGSGRVLEPVLVDRTSGRPLAELSVRPVRRPRRDPAGPGPPR